MSPLRNKPFWIGTVLIVVLLWTGLGLAAKWAQHRLNADPPRPVVDDSTASPGLKTLWPVPAFSFVDQDFQKTTNADFAGHVWVADFIYTQCTTACPVLSAKMVILQKQVPDPSVRFVSFSVDPAHDSPAVLAAYRNLWHGDPARWKLLSTDPAGLEKMVGGMHVVATKQDDPVNPIVHSDLFFLIDASGNVRGIYSSNDQSQLDQLAVDLRTLAGSTEAAASPADQRMMTAADRGRVVAGSMGCIACHSQPRVAPSLAGLYKSPVRLDDGRMVWADEAYLKESIVDPGAKIVQGYAKTMPAYGKLLTDDQMADLLAWLAGGADGASTAHPAAAPVELLVDPVCQMKVTAAADTPRAVWNGKTYYFCSENCRGKFLELHKSP